MNSLSGEDKLIKIESDPKEVQSDEKEKDVVDVEEIDSDIPLVQTVGEGPAKRLRSRKWKVVPSINETPKKSDGSVNATPKTRKNYVGVGPKKGWSKVMVKTTAGRTRKRKVVSSSESEYDVEKMFQTSPPLPLKGLLGRNLCRILEMFPLTGYPFISIDGSSSSIGGWV